MSEVTIDVAAVRGTAGGMRASGGVLTECARTVDACTFGPRDAGRAYSDHGRELQVGYARVGRAIAAMAASASACADALAVSTDDYAATDRSGANSLNGQL